MVLKRQGCSGVAEIKQDASDVRDGSDNLGEVSCLGIGGVRCWGISEENDGRREGASCERLEEGIPGSPELQLSLDAGVKHLGL